MNTTTDTRCVQCLSPRIETIEIRRGGWRSLFVHCVHCGHHEPRGRAPR